MANSTDQRLDQLEQKSNIDFVVGTLANGDSVRISKADLASVFGGLLKNWRHLYGAFDFNDIVEDGWYTFDCTQASNSPSMSFGVMRVTSCGNYLTQIVFQRDDNVQKIQYRIKEIKVWQKWS